MKTMSLALADRVYACTGATVRYHVIRHPQLRALCVDLRKFERALGEQLEDEYWRAFVRRLRRYRFELCATPLSAEQQSQRSRDEASHLAECLRYCDAIYSERLATRARVLVRQLGAVAESGVAAVLEGVIEAHRVRVAGARAVLLADSRLIGCAEESLAARRATSRLEVVGLTQVRGAPTYGQLIVVGPSRWFPSDVFCAPRAPRIDLICLDWIRDKWEPRPCLVAPVVGKSKTRLIGRGVIPEVSEDEEWGNPDAALEISDLVRASTRLDEGDEWQTPHEAVEARGYFLAGGKAVFLEADEGATVLTIDPAEVGSDRLRRVSMGELQPGDFVLLRTAGGGDYIVKVADRIMGKRAAHARRCQQHWKAKLRALVRKDGTAQVVLQLRDCGSERANGGNVRNWISPRGIRTDDKADFLAIMQLVRLQDKAEQYWEEMAAIDLAHRRAGRVIRKLLLALVADSSLTELERMGWMVFELRGTGAGSLTAFRVDRVSRQTVWIPEHRLGRPFDTDA